jgi:catechol 2,3-dioxygenase-like lactoylglutathione lyase family enzyme
MNRRRFLQTATVAGASSGMRRAGAIADSGGLGSDMQIRIARPTDKLDQVVAFYRDALGLAVIGHFENHAGYSGVMLGAPSAQFHLEFTHADAGSPCPAPSKDNLLVFYLPNAERYFSVLQRMTHYGHSPAEPENPYWKAKSKTFEDPDGWRVVLYNGSPFGAG